MKTLTFLSLVALAFARIPQRIVNEIKESEKHQGVDFHYGSFNGFGGLDYSYGDFYIGGFGGLSVNDDLPTNHSPFFSLCEPRRFNGPFPQIAGMG